MRKRFLTAVSTLIAAALASGSLVALASQSRAEFVPHRHRTEFTARVGQHGPRVPVQIAKPTLIWQIWSTEPHIKVKAVTMTVDERSVNAKYDDEARAVIYTPTNPLSAGDHKIYCQVTFDNDLRFDQRWVTPIAANSLSSLPPATREQSEAVSVLNEVRSRIGLPAVTQDDRLNMASQGHVHYLTVNNTTGHTETPGLPGYLATNGGDRIEIFGFVGTSWEDVAFGAHSVRESIEDLYSAPYHRVPFMMPGSPYFGSSFDNPRFTMEIGASNRTGSVIAPGDGQKGVPCAWHDFERPDPLRIHSTTTRVTGYPIVFSHFGAGYPRIRKMFAWLVGPDGKDVPIWLNTPDNDSSLTLAAILIPQKPLRPNSTYKVGFDGSDENGQTVRAETSFSTQAQTRQ